MAAGKVRTAAPEVIAYAEANGIDLAKVAATGANGAVTLDDVKAAVPEPYVTPLVAMLAAKHNVDLATVTGTGAGGRIRKDDVLRAAGVLPEGALSAEDQARATIAACDAVGL